MMTSDPQSQFPVAATTYSNPHSPRLHPQQNHRDRQNQRHSLQNAVSSGTGPDAATAATTQHLPTSARRPVSTQFDGPWARKPRTPRDVAKKLFEHAISSSSARASRRRPVCAPVLSDSVMSSPSETPRVMGGGMTGIPSHSQPPPQTPSPSMSTVSSRPSTRRRSSTVDSPLGIPVATSPAPMYEKPQASSSGGAVTMTIQLAEPTLFLQGLDGSENTRRPALLRGSMVLKVTKPTKIKTVTLTFRGRSRTEWPEGIPPKKSEYFEEKEIMQHTWPFFNAQFITAELGHCADSFHPRKTTSSSLSEGGTIGSAISHLTRSASPCPLEHKNGLQISHSRSFSKGESPNNQLTVAQRGYRVFQPGDYSYNFELPLDSCLPETVSVDLGSVKYELEGVIERPGAFRPNLTGKKEVVLVRVPSDSNLEQTEPIAISRTWEDQLHYDIVISGKAFPLGSSIPIAFKLTPLAKVRCHRIKIFITENVEYSCKNKKVHRLDPVRKVQLFEKRAEAPATSTFAGSSVRVVSGGGVTSPNGNNEDVVNGTDNLLGDLHGSPNVGPTELEFNVQLPGCNAKERDRIHFDTTSGSVHVHHWIKIVMRLSKQDPVDPNKRRHFEISIDSPFHILSCQATNANTTLPAYGALMSGSPSTTASCMCPQPNRRDSSRAGPLPQLTPNATPNSSSNSIPSLDAINRPIQLFRVPSAGPPPFDADVPPPLITPPPRYESVVDSSQGLADYFTRLAAATEDEDTDDDSSLSTHRGRLLLPLTPGGRVARSLDERRAWPVAQA